MLKQNLWAIFSDLFLNFMPEKVVVKLGDDLQIATLMYDLSHDPLHKKELKG